MKTKNGSVTENRIAEILPAENGITLAPPNIKTSTFVVRGITPLVMNNFNNRAKAGMAAKQQGVVIPKNFRVPQAEFFDSLYITPDNRQFYMKPNAFKRAICDASRLVKGIPGTLLGQALHVTDPYVIIHGSLPQMIEPVHRIGKWPNQVAIIQYRGQLDRWCAAFQVRWLSNVLTAEQVGYLIMYAGLGGIGDCRPNSKMNKGGTNGQFELVGCLNNSPEAKQLMSEWFTDPKVSEKFIREQQALTTDAIADAVQKLTTTDEPKAKAKGKAKP